MSSRSISRNSEESSNYRNDRSPLRNPLLDGPAHIWIALVVLIPIIVTLILCIIIVCIYQYKKKRAQDYTTNSSMTPIDQHNAATATTFHDFQRNPFVIEELPPSYDHISETKKDRQFISKDNNANEQFNQSPIKSPPYNSNFIDSTKSQDIYL